MKLLLSVNFVLICLASLGQDSIRKKESRFTLHAQETTVSQFRLGFSAKYTGAHSQSTSEEWATTVTSTIFAGIRLWKYSQLVINPEIAGGHGLSSAFGIAAFTNGEAFRVGNPDPTIYLARGFFRQLIPLSHKLEWQDDSENKVAQYVPKNYLSVTLGKVSVADYFDDNSFSHNARTQFMSWGLMSNGAWDYAANTRGYTPSAIVEYVSDRVEIRYGFSMMPVTANGNTMDKNIGKANGNVFEIKYKYQLGGRAGKIAALAFYNTAFMGSYTASNTLSVADTANPGFYKNSYTILASRQYGRSKYGYGLNIEQKLSEHIGLFAKASYNDGKNETWCFTEIDRAFSLGTLINGTKWRRQDDQIGLAYCASGLSNEHRKYLANGGMGFMLGDGKLNYGTEHLVESFYKIALIKNQINASLVYQYIINPGYNKDRGPMRVFSIRLHLFI